MILPREGFSVLCHCDIPGICLGATDVCASADGHAGVFASPFSDWMVGLPGVLRVAMSKKAVGRSCDGTHPLAPKKRIKNGVSFRIVI